MSTENKDYIYFNIEKMAYDKPDHPAIIFNNRMITYSQFNQKVQEMTRAIINVCPGPALVAMMIGRTDQLLVSLVAVIQNGLAFVPIDPELPENRIRQMIEDSSPQYIITDKDDVPGTLKLYEVEGTSICKIIKSKTSQKVDHRLAYLIYTSGSSGVPKGVMVPRQALRNFIQAVPERIDFAEHKKIVALTTISFDIFLLETLLPLTCGMTIVMISERDQTRPRRVAHFIQKYQVDMMQMTPSRMLMFLEDPKSAQVLSRMSEILIGGESFTHTLLGKIKRRTNARVYNMYGPTEATVWTSIRELEEGEPISIGKPIRNMALHVLDDQLTPVRDRIGELYISGDGVALGYLNRHQETMQSFIPNPFEQSAIRMFKTGDMARMLANGEIEIVGRRDRQVKIRGHRVELSEVEWHLSRFPGIEACYVHTKESTDGFKRLVAFYLSNQRLDPLELRRHLLHYLPDYMIPGKFEKLDQLKLNANGKTDRSLIGNYVE